MLAKVRSREAPSVCAASSSRRSTASMEIRIARTISGKAMIAAASAAPVQRNMKVRPNQSAKKRPAGPLLPNASSNSQPVTTGGRTSGKWISASSKILPGNRARASTQASPKATGMVTPTATALTFSERRITSHSSAVNCISGPAAQRVTKPRRAKMALPSRESRNRRKPSAPGLVDAFKTAIG